MSDNRLSRWAIRLVLLLGAGVLVPSCSLLGGPPSAGIIWRSNSSGPVAPGTPNPGNNPLWTDPNQAIPGPIGITGIGGVEITYGDADPTAFPSSNPESSHPVSTSRSLDPTGEATINGAVQQLYQPTIPIGNPQFVGNAGPSLLTGDTKLAGIARARAKHEALHPGMTAPDPGGLAARLGYMKINPSYTNPRQWEVGGPALTPAQAATQITAAIGALNLTMNTFGAAGYWTNGTTNYYCFVMVSIASGAP